MRITATWGVALAIVAVLSPGCSPLAPTEPSVNLDIVRILADSTIIVRIVPSINADQQFRVAVIEEQPHPFFTSEWGTDKVALSEPAPGHAWTEGKSYTCRVDLKSPGPKIEEFESDLIVRGLPPQPLVVISPTEGSTVLLSVEVAWIYSGASPATYFHVTVEDSASRDAKSLTLTGECKRVIIGNLYPGGRYTGRISAESLIGGVYKIVAEAKIPRFRAKD